MRFDFLPVALCLLLLASCATSRHAERRFSKKIQKEVEKSAVFNRAFTGFTLLDPATGKTLADVNGDKYFIPASNTKILTLATCLEVLGDSVPGLQYYAEDSNLIFQGTADPTFLHPEFQFWQPVYHFLAKTPQKLLLRYQEFDEPRFGPGWAWDDYTEPFQAEKTAFPIYGNTIRLLGLSGGRFEVRPSFFRTSAQRSYYGNPRKDISRREGDNLIEMRRPLKAGEEIIVPIRMPGWEYVAGDTLRRSDIEPAHYHVEIPANPSWTIMYSLSLDTVLRRMMYQSDNFIAEQMLLVCAGQKFDVLRQDTMIKWMLDSVLASLPQRPRWVDGSGLSRYNLISPRDLAQVLFKLWKEQPHEFLLSLFPAGGVNGTVSDWYKGKDGKPYVFAKTGSVSGVHCLSGYVVTKRGKTLIFTFMHNNFVGSNRAWKAEMQRILEIIWENY